MTTLPASAQCTISTTPVSFGTYNVFATAPTDSVGTVRYFCLLAVHIQVSLSRGTANSFAPRLLQSGPERLSYNLYRDAARTSVWVDGTGGTSVHTAPVATLANVTLQVFGRIPPEQDVRAGPYTDTIIATINF